MEHARDWLAEFRASEGVPKMPNQPKTIERDSFGNFGSFGTGADDVNTIPPAVPLALPDELEERAALASSLAGPIPEEWRRGFASLQRMAPPKGMVRGRWHEIINDAGRFLDAWGPQAASLGWMAADVFGINPKAPDVNNDNAGLAVMMMGRPVVAITAETATIQVRQAVRQTYRRHRRPGAVLLWELEP